MRPLRALFFVAVTSLASGGCLARQVAKDGICIRHALLDMYTDQAMDNLIRAFENRPFVQLAYSQLSVLDQDKVAANANGGEADFTRSRSFDASKATPALQFMRGLNFSGKIPFAGNGERDRTLSFHADPVTDQNAIYEAYLAFAKDPTRFVTSTCKPPCPVHILRQCGDKWYWVPAEAGPAFLKLVLNTSFTPGQPGPVYWTSSIVSVAPRYDEKGRAIGFVITLSSEIPNDSGTMLVTPKVGKPIALQIQALDVLPITKDAPDKTEKVGPLRGTPTKMLYTQKLPTDVTAESLKGAAVRFIAEVFRNTKSQPAADTQKIQDTLENIRLLLNKTTPVNP